MPTHLPSHVLGSPAPAPESESERATKRALDLLRAVPDAIVVTDLAGRIEQINDRAIELFGYQPDELLGRPVEVLVPGAARAAHRRDREAYATEVTPTPMSGGSGIEAVRKDGTTVPVAIELSTLELPTGRVMLASARDISAQRAAEQALQDSEQRFRLAFEEAPIGMALVGLQGDQAGRFMRVNQAMCHLVGYSQSDLIGKNLRSLDHPEDRTGVTDPLARMASGEIERWEVEQRYRHAAGHELWVHVTTIVARRADGTPDYTVTQIQDITARKHAETELTHQALHDPLTGLANRMLMLDHLDQALARSSRSGVSVALLFLDLDDFKLINDSLGHEAGDELLIEVARRLSRCIRSSDTVARFGGDEFIVVCEEITGSDDLERVLERVQRTLKRPFDLLGQDITIRASIGVATSSHEGDARALLRDADSVMYQAKSHGKGRYEIADHDLQARAARQLSIEAELRAAIGDGQLRLEYQPCVELGDDRVVAVEALLRWDHPTQGVLMPDAFLDIAESRGLIVPLGEWVIQTACEQARDWRERFGEDAPVMWVNASSRQLGKHELTKTILAALDRTGLGPSQLGVELTEREIVAAAHSVLADLEDLHAAGVALAIDDFGTGHNGLGYLRELPVDTVKIDKSFIAGLGTDRTDTALTTGITALAHSLDLEVVAEGVETIEQQEFLRTLDCDRAQGYFLGRPGRAELITSRLAV